LCDEVHGGTLRQEESPGDQEEYEEDDIRVIERRRRKRQQRRSKMIPNVWCRNGVTTTEGMEDITKPIDQMKPILKKSTTFGKQLTSGSFHHINTATG
jgi:type VI protein secretion system component Hcp